jgi:hypothetical protein
MSEAISDEAGCRLACGCLILMAFVIACAITFCTMVSHAPHNAARATPTPCPASSETPVSSWEQVQ